PPPARGVPGTPRPARPPRSRGPVLSSCAPEALADGADLLIARAEPAHHEPGPGVGCVSLERLVSRASLDGRGKGDPAIAKEAVEAGQHLRASPSPQRLEGGQPYRTPVAPEVPGLEHA